MFSSLSLDVIDPCNRTGKISIPMPHVVGTKGVSDFHSNPAKRDGKELSLCLLYQKGRCNAGSKCHQVHADPEFVATLREKALSVKNCCAAHGDVHSTGFATTNMTVAIYSGDDVQLYTLSSFARTSFLDGILRNASSKGARAPASKICRLHAQSRCKFGKDCKNIHLCSSACPITPTPMRVAAPVAVDVSCGLSNKSSEESTPREGAAKSCGPLPLDSLMLHSEQEFSCVSSTWGAAASPQFDMSAFEDTIRCLCLDLTAKEDPMAVCPPAKRQ